MRFIDYFRSIVNILPEVSVPLENMNLQDRGAWTMGSMLIFLVLSNLKLYGASISSVPDPFSSLRPAIASNRGTLMELGIVPIATSGLILQMLSGFNRLSVRHDSIEDRGLFSGFQKLFAISLLFMESVLYVFSGMLGDIAVIGIANAILLIVQLFLAGFVVILLDEMIQKGYGIGSGLNLFITGNACKYLLCSGLSPSSIDEGRGREFEGAIIAFFHFMYSRSDRIGALKEVLFRSHLPNLSNLFGIIILFVIALHFQGWRFEVSVKHNKIRGQTGAYPIKFFYTGGISLLFLTCVIANIHFFSHILYKLFGNNVFIKIIGHWEMIEGFPGAIFPIGGLAYYISPPLSVIGALKDPFHTLFYGSFVIVICGIFARVWTDISGNTGKDVTRFIQDQNLVITNMSRNESMTKYLDLHIPMAAIIGGMCIGALSFVGDFLSITGLGTSILISMTTMYQYYEMFARERAGINMKQQ